MDMVRDQQAPWARTLLDGVLASLRAVVPALLASFACAVAAWIVTIDQQIPVSSVFGWTISVIGVSAGFTLSAGGLVLSLPPSLLSLLFWLGVFAVARRLRRAHAQSTVRTRAASFSGFVALPVLGTAAAVLAPGIRLDAVGAARAAILVISACVLGLRPGFTALADHLGLSADRLVADVGHWLRRLFIALGIVAVLLLAVSLVAQWDAAGDVVAQYSSPVAAAIGLGVLQALFAPMIWAGALAWTSGAGVTLSSGTLASVYHATAASRPGLPVFALVPSHTAAWMPWLGLAILIAVAVTVLGRPAWQRQSSWSTIGIRTVVAFVALTCVGLFAMGSVGPGGLREFGVSVWRFPLVLTGFVAAGLLVSHLMLLASARANTDGEAVDG